MRVVTFGRQPTETPQHNFAEIHFPELAKVDEGTKEGMVSRVLSSDGGAALSLPRTVYFQKQQADGHMASVAVGSLHEVTIDGEAGLVSGKGYLLDSAEGHDAALHIAGQALFHNSVDLAQTKVDITEHGDYWDADFWMEVVFTEWSVGATTLVGKPAFSEAHAVMPAELTAAIEAGPLIVDCESRIEIKLVEREDEILASASGLPSWADFHRPEPKQHHKIIVDAPREDGSIPVYGHLSLWNTCHDGIEGKCTVTPRPSDNYASFNKPSVLTDKGQVEAGPISLFGGHIPLHKAADDPANAWCDVRVTAGVHGPWLSGVVRPGITPDDAKVYVARASRISGHWKGTRLKMIVCCNAEGFDVPGSGFSFSTNAKGEVAELVASYPGCAEPTPVPTFDEIASMSSQVNIPAYLMTMDPLTPGQQTHLMSWVQTRTTSVNTGEASVAPEGTPTEADEFDADVERMRRVRQQDLLEHGDPTP